MTDQRDMGPFADMDADLVHAITSYGTPPYRQTARVNVRNVDNDDFSTLPTSPLEWIAWMNDAIQDTPEQYRHRLTCILDWHPGYYDTEAWSSLAVGYMRPETDDEMRKRVGRGVEYVREKQDAERRTYEALKQKFGCQPFLMGRTKI